MTGNRCFAFVLIVLIVSAGVSQDAPEAEEIVAVPKTRSETISISLSAKADLKPREEKLQSKLHFSIFENGKHDLIYVATRSGLWMMGGEFDLSVNGKVIFTGKLKDDLLGAGVLIDMGDVVQEVRVFEFGRRVCITRITGDFK